MEIFVQARKDGYNILFPKPTPKEFYKFASDLQSASAKNDSKYYGKNFYSLAFADGGFIFTKYVIGYDIQRNNIGNVGISVFIPVTQKLSGDDVKKLLDELISVYCQNYCDDNKITNKREDWQKLTSVLKRHEVLPGDNFNDSFITVGSKEPAFHYYKNDSELIELFGNPFKEEYAGYKQVFFIDNQLKDTANPLDVIKNSGVEVNPDLKNEYYYLNKYNSSKEVKITAYYDNKWNDRSDKKGENQIRAKWKVEINYSKNNRCYEPINKKGTISDRSSEIHNYIEIKGNHIFLKYDAFSNPTEKVKPVNFEIKDKDGKSIDGADIYIGTRHLEKVSGSTKTIDFKGEDIIKQWEISAKKESEYLYSGPVPITPENQNEMVLLTLHKRKKVKFQGVLEGRTNPPFFPDITISIQGKNLINQKPECDFVDDEINQTYKVTASYSRAEVILKGETEFCPNDVDSVSIELKKLTHGNNNIYALDMGEYGIASAEYSNSETGNDISVNVKTKGYFFTGFILDLNKKHDNFDGTLIAKYEQQKSFFSKTLRLLKTPHGVAYIGVTVLFLFMLIMVMRHFSSKVNQSKETPLTDKEITSYVEGDSLDLIVLKNYHANWKKLENDFISKSGVGLFGGEENADSSKWKSDWQPVNEKLEKAITKRNLINKMSFEELKNLNYSTAQQSFKTAIEKIDSSKYTEVIYKLGNVSALTLTQIADSINAILTLKNQRREENKPEQEKVASVKTEQKQEQPMLQERKISAPPTQIEAVSIDKTSEIIQYIKGSELHEAKLIEYKNTKGINQNLKNSIQLCLDFWALDGSGSGKKSKTYWNFRVKVYADDNFNNSKLKAFLDKMCQEGASPSYSEQDKKKGLR